MLWRALATNTVALNQLMQSSLTNYSLEKYTEEFFDNEDLNAKNHVDVMFIHSNFPKFDPYDLSKSNFLTTNGKPARSYTALKKVKNYDIELENFKVLKNMFVLIRILSNTSMTF